MSSSAKDDPHIPPGLRSVEFEIGSYHVAKDDVVITKKERDGLTVAERSLRGRLDD